VSDARTPLTDDEIRELLSMTLNGPLPHTTMQRVMATLAEVPGLRTRLDALPVPELSANAVMRFGDAVCDSLHVPSGSAWVNGRETIAALRAAGFAIVEVKPG